MVKRGAQEESRDDDEKDVVGELTLLKGSGSRERSAEASKSSKEKAVRKSDIEGKSKESRRDGKELPEAAEGFDLGDRRQTDL